MPILCSRLPTLLLSTLRSTIQSTSPTHLHLRLRLLLSRPASHASQGRANKAAAGPGKRLGAKKGASELVVPGNIIFRQRGTHWYPGENCAMGRDHTIFAKEKGYVCFYRDDERHPKRKFIGVVFERGERLPRAKGVPRRRRLGLVGRARELEVETEVRREVLSGKGEGEGLEFGKLTGQGAVIRQQGKRARKEVPVLKKMELRPGYQYRHSNWYIGRAAERAKIRVREYKRGDRFLAWRKLNARKARNAEKRSLSSRKNKGGKK